MATNMIYKKGDVLEIAVPSGITSGDPVVVNNITGVALTDRDSDGNASVKFDGVFDLSVKGIDTDGNSAVAIGDIIYWVSGDTPKLSKKNSGTAFGVALETISSGSTDTIKVKLLDISMIASLSAGSVGLTQLNTNQKVRLVTVALGTLSATATFTIFAAIKACEIKSATFLTSTADAVDASNFWTISVIDKGTDGSGTDVVATQNSDSGDGNQAFVAYDLYPLTVATGGEEDITAGSVLVLTATKAASADNLEECSITLEIEVADA